MIFLSRNGKAFAAIDGFLKEEIENGVGILGSVIVTVVVTIGSVRWSWVVVAVKWLWSFFKQLLTF